MLIQYVGMFMTGFHTGVMLAIAGLDIYDHFLDSRPTAGSICISSLVNVYSTILCVIIIIIFGYIFFLSSLAGLDHIYGPKPSKCSVWYVMLRMCYDRELIRFNLFV
ncbi:hypothetical protein PYW08_000460 [Mythimna loreyi]|uniref:Uncharacterized protein n=1 Tax=Mythimna loreyi TaxID=667449 RepID=A0ACC2RCI0_9NEOP|nr:hypothetical protein PYW08_000460 [Mythimna loreyi]